MMNAKHDICKSFNAHAHEYEQAAKIQYEIGRRMYDRLTYLKISPIRILDLGCGTGLFSHQLKKRYPKAQITGFDLAYNMLSQAKSKQSWRCKWPLVNGDMMNMPFANETFDLIFANQVVHWGSPMKTLFGELNRILNAEGCLMFTTLGPDTFKELKMAWSNVDAYAHSNEFADMHDIGDWLLLEHFLEPVVDMEVISVHYDNLLKLVRTLKAQGVKNINPQRSSGLTGRQLWQQFEENYSNYRSDRGKYPLSYEVVYGHAWKGRQKQRTKGMETFIPVSTIRKRNL